MRSATSTSFKAGHVPGNAVLTPQNAIDIRIDQLRGTMGIRNREQLCAELLHIRLYLDE